MKDQLKDYSNGFHGNLSCFIFTSRYKENWLACCPFFINQLLEYSYEKLSVMAKVNIAKKEKQPSANIQSGL